MEILLEALFGPLAAVECRRSLGRGWVLVVRVLATVPPATVLLAVLWLWWFGHMMAPSYSPRSALIWGLVASEAILVTVALVLAAALLAGTMAGEQVRSTLGLLLAAAVSAPEIVLGRLIGRLCVVGVVMAAGLPFLVWLAAMCGLGPPALATLLALPVAVAFGCGGLAMAVSVSARRGRDALLVVYLLEFVLLLATSLTWRFSPSLSEWIEPINPYQGIWLLSEQQDIGLALVTIGWWTLLGVAGCIWAACRLRPNFLRSASGPRQRWRLFRPARLSSLGDRPMVWKELYVEQVNAFSRIIKWLGILVVILFSGTSILFSGMVLGGRWGQLDAGWSNWALLQLTDWLAWSWLIVWLIQLALGLRAAAAIASERQRGTWDGLLVSPLTGREIVLAKIYGNLYALRGFFAVVILAWAAGLLCGALAMGDFALLLAQTIVIGGFMVALGIGLSLFCGSATTAIELTIVCWLAVGFVMTVLAGILAGMVLFAWFVCNLAFGGMPSIGPNPWPILYHGFRFVLYALAALLIAAYLQRRFDALAGRSDLHGEPGA